MKFIDEARITVSSGKGGAGCVSFRREKYVPRGGPDGGDGGRGGHVIFKTESGLNSLLNFHFKKHFKASDGQAGSSRKMSGLSGEDLIITVPPGTLVYDVDDNLIVDLKDPDMDYQLLEGGRGGKGNWHFKNSINQTPHYAQPGEQGNTIELKMELRLIADVGLVGLPNVGKSTLISALSAARPKVADYPFTTLVPNLGVVQGPDGSSFVLTDIPGLIEGAAEGAGLGHAFLRHVMRTRLLVIVLDPSPLTEEPVEEQVAVLEKELQKYQNEFLREQNVYESLSEKPRIYVINKVDAVDAKELQVIQTDMAKKGLNPLLISGATRYGLKELTDQISNHLDRMIKQGEKIG